MMELVEQLRKKSIMKSYQENAREFALTADKIFDIQVLHLDAEVLTPDLDDSICAIGLPKIHHVKRVDIESVDLYFNM